MDQDLDQEHSDDEDEDGEDGDDLRNGHNLLRVDQVHSFVHQKMS